MKPVSLFKKNYGVEFRDIDFTKKLKMSALFNFFQDIASLAVDNLNIGINTIQEQHGVAWILIRIRVDIIRTAEWNEEVEIETWPQQPKKLEFERDFIVRDSQGNVIAKAVSTWIIADINTREIRRSELLGIEYPPIITERAIDCRLGKFKALGELQLAYKKVIGYSDIDINGHLNNSKYIDYIMDCFTVENHMKYGIKSIEVSFVNEALPGDIIKLYKDISAIDSNLLYIEGVNELSNKICFKTKVEVHAKC